MPQFAFGAGILVATPTNLADGTPIAAPTPVIIGTVQDVSVDLSVEMKTLYGNKRYPVAIGQGKGKTEIKAKYASLDGSVIGGLFLGKAPTAGIKAAAFDVAATIPASPGPYTVTASPPNSGTFVADLGVFRVSTGAQMTRVSTSPAAGQYAVSAGGVYTFAAADQGAGIMYSYEYSANSGGQVYTLTNEVMGYTPSFSLLLQNDFDGKKLVLKLDRAVSGKLNVPLKNDDFAMYDFEAEAFANASGSLGYICLVS